MSGLSITDIDRGAVVECDARLVVEPGERHPNSWSITHGFGSPAERTYTEVRIEPNLDGSPSTAAPLPDHVVEVIVRNVARSLYGDAWAFHYAPDSFESAVGRYGMRRREVVAVEGVEVLS